MKLHGPPLGFLELYGKFFRRSVELDDTFCLRPLEVCDFQAAWFWRLLMELNQERFWRFWAVLGGPAKWRKFLWVSGGGTEYDSGYT